MKSLGDNPHQLVGLIGLVMSGRVANITKYFHIFDKMFDKIPYFDKI